MRNDLLFLKLLKRKLVKNARKQNGKKRGND